ncbi:MAG: HAMP domain-containing histidine kinase [Candidatus Peribacteria bacterium]|jgi:signal transduction histidine kinase|nr:HAMP domain-containing histidine kinase [Candidatus Peribacteria bacterium]
MGEISNDARVALNHCYDSSVRLIKLTNDVLALSKIEAGKMEYYMTDVEVVPLLKAVYNDVFLEAKAKQIDFQIEIDKNLIKAEINTDEDKIKQVFINLVNNAIKFTPEQGKVILKATKIKNKILFEVIDNGV